MEVAVLIGLQAAGKSTFCRTVLAADHVVVSKDAFPNARNPQRRQMQLVEQALATGHSVVIDNTNPSPLEWRPLIDAARAHGATAVGYWFPPDLATTLRRNATRTGRSAVPEVGIMATLNRMRRPAQQDGFDRRYEVRVDGLDGFLISPMEEE